jgi:hypothetical protein
MNFKPTLWKAAFSLLIIILGPTLIVSSVYHDYVFVNPITAPILFGRFNSVLILLASIILYTLWSLFQKK